MIAWFGTGLLGANFVRALRRRGEDVRVWNRTAARAKALEAEGATAFEDPAEAARGADRAHLALSDDEAVDDVLERARPGLAAGAAIVDHTTTSPQGAAARLKRWDERGMQFLHAPVFMGPPNALDGTGVMLASGDKARFDALEPALRPMTGQVVYLGAQPDRAAAFKLMGNLFLMSIGVATADMLKLGKAMGVPAEEAATLFNWLKPGGMIEPRLKRFMAADFGKAYWELVMARKDARLMLEASEKGPPLLLIPALAAEMDRWIAAGHGHDDWIVIGKEAL
jgi:3-hydroxyisobutyrate dehydrogenase